MADLPASLTPVPRNRIPAAHDAAPPRPFTAAEVELVVDGASRLADILNRSAMRRITVSMEGVHWDIEAPATAPVAAATAPVAAEVAPTPGQPVTAPLVGVFYRSKSPGAAPFVEVGSRVEVGQPVAIVEAMKLMNEVVAARAGVVTAVHAEDGEVVEFGQPLFTVDAA